MSAQLWRLSHRADPFARDIADRHYNRQKIGSPQFVPPGRCLVLTTHSEAGRAFWVTSWPFAEFVKHEWPGAWVCSAFRNEGLPRTTKMIRQAVAASKAYFGEPPSLGMVTFIDRDEVQPTVGEDGEPEWGRTWLCAGFRHVGFTKGGLMAWQLLPRRMPRPLAAIGTQPDMFEAVA